MWLSLLACTAPSPEDPPPVSTADTAPEAPRCPVVEPGVDLGRLDLPALTEASGLVARDGLLWVHNDSGTPQLFALDPLGALQATVSVQSPLALDWEDATWREGRLWVGDVGDNLAARTTITLLELAVDAQTPDGAVVTPRALPLVWPGGPRDCEAMLGDPVTGDLLLVPKVLDGAVDIHRVVDPDAATTELEPVASLQFGEGLLTGNTLVTGGEVAPDGSAVVLRTYLDAFVWPRTPGEPWADTFGRDPCRVELETEPQGETVAWADDALYTVSEGDSPTLWRYPVQPAR
jgi:hypothetical protein